MAYDEHLAHRVRELVWDEPDLVEKRMFGGLAFLVGGHLAVAVSGNGGLMVRVGPAASDALLADPQVSPMQMHGRATTGWIRVSPEGIDEDTHLQAWVARALDVVYALPPKPE